MLLNADRLKRVVSNTNKIPWVNSPIPSVERRMIEITPYTITEKKMLL